MKEVDAEVGELDIIGELFTVVSSEVSGFISMGLWGPAPKVAASNWFISIIDMFEAFDVFEEGLQGRVLRQTERES